MSGVPVLSPETRPDPRLKKGKSVSFVEGQSKSAPSSPYPIRGQAGDGYVFIFTLLNLGKKLYIFFI
jgi:hypothetical protein